VRESHLEGGIATPTNKDPARNFGKVRESAGGIGHPASKNESFARKRAGLSAAPLAAAAVATSTTVAATATAAAIAAPAAAAAIAATTAAIATAAASATGRASFTRARFVHGQGTAFDRLAIELRDCLLGVCFRCHRDKGEAARLTGELILHQRDLLDWSRLSEKILQICFGRVEGKISYV
jgi:uncharacterized membrane protein YphA (DoxX/SURF4 family)